MPVLRTLQNLQTAIRRRLGWGSTDSFVTDAELKDMIVESQHELHDLLIMIHSGEYALNSATVALAADTNQVSPVSGAGLPVYKLHRVAVDFDNVSVPMKRFDLQTSIMDSSSYSWDQGSDLRYHVTTAGHASANPMVIHFHPTPDSAQVVKLMYNRTPYTLSLSTDTNIGGHDEYIILDCCAKLAQMEESDASVWLAQKAAYRERLENLAPPKDHGQAPVLQDTRSVDSWRSDWQVFRRNWW